MTTRNPARTSVLRPVEYFDQPATVRREVLVARPELAGAGMPGGITGEDTGTGSPPVLLVPGLGHAAWLFSEHWLDQIAARGFLANAMSLRGHGRSGGAGTADLRAYAHDVIQVAASLPRQAVLVGHGAGALVVAMAMARYPARAGVLVAPVFGGIGTAATLLRHNPIGTLAGLMSTVRLSHRQLFCGELPAASAREYADRLSGASRRAQWQLLRRHRPEPAVGNPPVLVVGSPDDRIVAASGLDRVARAYGGAPLLFPGMGHDMPVDARWWEPIDAICDWLAGLDAEHHG